MKDRLDSRAFRAERSLMQRDIKLDGGEISIIKALGLSGTGMNGKMLHEQTGEMESGELVDSLSALISLGYVLSTKANVHSMEDVERATFRINPSYARDLRDALRPGGRPREERQRRSRR